MSEKAIRAHSPEEKEGHLTPLRKIALNTGETYRRFPHVEGVLKQLLALSPKERVLRCEIDDEESTDFVPSECLVFLVRSCRHEPVDSYFHKLYSVLMARIIQRLPAATSGDGKKVYLKEERIQEGVVDAFQELLALDRGAYEERLDFWEVAFGKALKTQKVTIQDKVWREANKSAPFENAETGEIATEVLEAAGTFDPFDSEELWKKDYRESLPWAIDKLTQDQKRIIKMCLDGFPIHSDNPKTVTISKILKLSDKTVRTKRKEALVALKKILEQGDNQ